MLNVEKKEKGRFEKHIPPLKIKFLADEEILARQKKFAHSPGGGERIENLVSYFLYKIIIITNKVSFFPAPGLGRGPISTSWQTWVSLDFPGSSLIFTLTQNRVVFLANKEAKNFLR